MMPLLPILYMVNGLYTYIARLIPSKNKAIKDLLMIIKVMG